MSGPADHNIDGRQLRALVRLKLLMTLRPTVDSSTGKIRVRPLRALTLSYGFLGFMFGRNSSAFADARSFTIVLFSSVLAIGMVTVLPDAVEGQRRDHEILSSKPIGLRTMALARATHLFILVGLIVGCLALVPIVQLWTSFGVAPVLAAALFVMLLVAAFLASMLWTLAQLLVLRWFPVDRVRAATQILLTVAIVCFSSSTLIVSLLARSADGELLAITSELFRLLPPVWFADFVLGDGGWMSNTERVLVFASLALTFGLVLITTQPRLHAELMEQILEPAAVRGRPPLALRVLRALARLPLARHWLVSPRGLGVASLILIHGAREPIAQARLLPLRLLLLGIGACDVFAFRTETPFPSVMGAMILIEGLRLTSQSPQASASWVLRSAPLRPRDVLDGIRAAALVGYFGYPFLLASVTFFVHRPPAVAAMFALGFLIEGHILTSLSAGLDPAWPLSREQRMPLFFAYVVGWLLIGGLAALRSALLTDGASGMIHLAALLGAALAARHWSARRFAVHADEKADP